MLNLSDKELDRLSREAAQEHEPGDIVGPRSWDKLQVHLDRDLGRVSPNRLGSFRRLPFYFAPAVLLILGVSYYFVRQNKARKEVPSGSPPLTVVQSTIPAEKNDPSTKTLDHSKNSTSVPGQPPVTAQYPASPDQSGTASASSSAAGPSSSATPSASSSLPSTGSSAASLTPSPSASSPSGRSTALSTTRSGNAGSTPNNKTRGTTTSPGLPGTNHSATGTDRSVTGTDRSATGKDHSATGTDRSATGKDRLAKNNRTRSTRNNNVAGGNNSAPGFNAANGQSPVSYNAADRTKDASNPSAGNLTARDAINGHSGAGANDGPPSLEFTLIQHPGPMKRSPRVDDSALRAFTVKTMPPGPIKRKGVMMENRRLQIGLSVAPDFTSVNSLAGDHPGSSIGLTADYQFASRWYIGTGLLVTRKNYAARAQDYHAPYSFYQSNNLHNIDYEKGTMYMMEVPLNLRYDFSVTGSTLFFASAGVSSYLFTKENCNYYYNNFGREFVRGFDYPNKNNYLFSSVNLSMGVETGITNSFSLLVAPYMKLPTHNIGFGQLQMNSVGVNFVLKYTPVLSRKRR